MDNFVRTLRAIDSICKKNKIRYALIGGLALAAHGFQRFTQDIDITLLVNLEEINKIGKLLLQEFEHIKKNPIEFFERYFVLPVLYKPTGIKVDFSAGVSNFDIEVIKRSRKIFYYNIKIPVCSVEDLIIYKLVASRDQDLIDVEEIFKRPKRKFNKKYLTETAKSFQQLERYDILENLEMYFKRFGI